MKKTVFISILALLVLTFSVSAWHCTDTDQAVPKPVNYLYGTWGDNGLLGGTTLGWTDNGNAPAGCTGTQGNYVCQDQCNGNTLVEYYCGDRPSNPSETVIFSKNYKDSTQCIPQTPEFGVIAGGVALIGALGIFVFLRKNN